MGVMIRLKDAKADNDSLEIIPLPYTGVGGAKFVTESRISTLLSRDVSGNAVPVQLQGAPTFTENYLRGGGRGLTSTGPASDQKWLVAQYAPLADAPRTMCVAARYVSGKSGWAFALSDHTGSQGCSLFISDTSNWRGQVILVNSAGATSSAFPSTIPNLPTINRYDFNFAVLVVDAPNKKASFMLPAYNFEYAITWDALLTVATGTGHLRIAGSGIAGPDSCDVAFASYHDRVLTKEECLQQYYAAKNYCEAVGVTVV